MCFNYKFSLQTKIEKFKKNLKTLIHNMYCDKDINAEKNEMLFTVFLENMYSKYKSNFNYNILHNDEKILSIFTEKKN